MADAPAQAELTPSLEGQPCLNCKAPLPEPRPRFCSHCGQETALRPPTLGEFLQQFGGAYFSTEGALWRTLALLLRPGELTMRYLAGQRKHYVLPLRLYLSVSVLVLVLMRLQVGLGGGGAIEFSPASKPDDFSFSVGGVARAGLKDGRFYCENLPGAMCQRLQRRLSLDPQGMQLESQELGKRYISNLGAAMFVLLPLFAALLKLAFLNRGQRYTEHLVAAFHLHTFWFVAVGLTLPGVGWLAGLALLSMPIYTWLTLKRIHGGRAWPMLLRVGFVAAGYSLALILALTVLGLWTVLF